MTSIVNAESGVILIAAPLPGGALPDRYRLVYDELCGWYLQHYNASTSAWTTLATTSLSAAVGVVWYMTVDISTSNGNTSFNVYYVTSSSGPFTLLLSYMMAITVDVAAVGLWFYSSTTASTPSTGHHISSLYLQDISPLSTATLIGPPNTSGLIGIPVQFTVSLNEPAGPGGVVVTPASTVGTDTFQATRSGPNVTSITIPEGSTSTTFWLTPG